MNDTSAPSRAELLRLIEAAGPRPWFPSEYAAGNGADRDGLDGPLGDLRVAGVVELTEWQPGRGQGYRLTDLGREVLAKPAYLRELDRQGSAPRAARDAELDRRALDPVSAWDRGEAVRGALLNPIRPIVTPILIAACFTIFGVGLWVAVRNLVPVGQFLSNGGNPEILHQTGAIRATDLTAGQWWRMLTCCFVHVGVFHLLMNMYVLFMIGPQAEQMWGRLRFLALYLLAGLGGSWAAMIEPPNPQVSLAGASGAIIGVLASIGGWVLLNRRHLPPALVSRALRSLGLNAAIIVVISLIPGVSWQAHAGGAAVGFLASGLMNWQRFGTPAQRAVALAALAALPALGAWSLDAATRTGERWRAVRVAQRVQDALELHARVGPPLAEAFRAVEELRRDPLLALLNKDPAGRGEADVRRAMRELDRLAAKAAAESAELGAVEAGGEEAVEIKRRAAEFWQALAEYARLSGEQLRQPEARTRAQKTELLRAWDGLRLAAARFPRRR